MGPEKAQISGKWLQAIALALGIGCFWAPFMIQVIRVDYEGEYAGKFIEYRVIMGVTGARCEVDYDLSGGVVLNMTICDNLCLRPDQSPRDKDVPGVCQDIYSCLEEPPDGGEPCHDFDSCESCFENAPCNFGSDCADCGPRTCQHCRKYRDAMPFANLRSTKCWGCTATNQRELLHEMDQCYAYARNHYRGEVWMIVCPWMAILMGLCTMARWSATDSGNSCMATPRCSCSRSTMTKCWSVCCSVLNIMHLLLVLFYLWAIFTSINALFDMHDEYAHVEISFHAGSAWALAIVASCLSQIGVFLRCNCQPATPAQRAAQVPYGTELAQAGPHPVIATLVDTGAQQEPTDLVVGTPVTQATTAVTPGIPVGRLVDDGPANTSHTTPVATTDNQAAPIAVAPSMEIGQPDVQGHPL